MRHRWRHLPCCCRRWARAFSSDLSRAARSGSISTGRFTVIFTWNNMLFSSDGMNGSGGFVAAEKRQPLFVQAQAKAGGLRNMQMEIAVNRRLAEDVFGQQQRAEQLGVPT